MASSVKVLQDCEESEFVGVVAGGVKDKAGQGCKLSLSECRKLTNTSLTALGGSNLLVLNVSFLFKVTDSGLASIALNCRQLREIYCDGLNLLTDLTCRCLADGCKQLHAVSLKYCHLLTDLGIDALARGLLLLESIFLSCCPGLRDASLEALSSCSLLCTVDLASCPEITDAGIGRLLPACPRITHLVLDNCPMLSNETVAHILKSLPRVRHLGLSGLTALTDPALRALSAKCLYLQFVDLSFCSGLRDGHFVKYTPLQDKQPKAAEIAKTSTTSTTSTTSSNSTSSNSSSNSNSNSTDGSNSSNTSNSSNSGTDGTSDLQALLCLQIRAQRDKSRPKARPGNRASSSPSSCPPLPMPPAGDAGRVGPPGPSAAPVTGPAKRPYIAKGTKCEFFLAGLPRQGPEEGARTQAGGGGSSSNSSVSGGSPLPPLSEPNSPLPMSMPPSLPPSLPMPMPLPMPLPMSMPTTFAAVTAANRPPLPPPGPSNKRRTRTSGRVAKSHLNGFYDVEFSHTDVRLPASELRLSGGLPRFLRGNLENAHVEGNYELSGLWLRGRIVRVHPGSLFDVQYTNLEAAYVAESDIKVWYQGQLVDAEAYLSTVAQSIKGAVSPFCSREELSGRAWLQGKNAHATASASASQGRGGEDVDVCHYSPHHQEGQLRCHVLRT